MAKAGIFVVEAAVLARAATRSLGMLYAGGCFRNDSGCTCDDQRVRLKALCKKLGGNGISLLTCHEGRKQSRYSAPRQSFCLRCFLLPHHLHLLVPKTSFWLSLLNYCPCFAPTHSHSSYVEACLSLSASPRYPTVEFLPVQRCTTYTL